MSEYKFISDDSLDKRGFISKEQILDAVSQEDIFRLVFKEVPEEYEYISSPFRADRNPGCWFEYYADGRLRFKDFGNTATISGISMRNIDCFDAVQVFYRIPNFFMTLEFIHNTLIRGKEILLEKQIPIYTGKPEKKPVKLITESRKFEPKDRTLWGQWGITDRQLIEDKVFPISRFHALNTKKGNISSHCFDLAYSFNEFPQGRKKIYFPHREGKSRFLTTCTKDDIGGMLSPITMGRQLIITKSYKDWRVLLNQGKNVRWFQNEGMIPDLSLITMLVKHFEEVIVFFDNDPTGIQASQIIAAIINSIYPGKARALWLPEELLEQKITDPSDLYFCKGRAELVHFLRQYT